MKVEIKKDVPRGYWYSNLPGSAFNVFYTGSTCYHVLSYGLVKEIEKDHCIVKDNITHYEYYNFKNEDPHYDNSNGSLYKFAIDHGLNSYEFDIIKRVVRCRKKGHFKEDLEKTKRVIDLYLKEQQ